MSYKWIGAIFIVGSCGGFGIQLALHQKNEERLLEQLRGIMDEMLWELIRHAVHGKKGILRDIFLELAIQLDRQVLPDAQSCMNAAMGDRVVGFPHLQSILSLLGQSLGRFDLSGQLKGLAAVGEKCREEIRELHLGRDVRLKSYRVLGLCAGAALVILLL